jgi:ATP-dependent Lon protease
MVILPKRNEPDIDDIPDEIRGELTFVFVDRMEEVLDAALRQRVTEPPVASSDSHAPVADGNGVEVEDAREGVETAESK